MFIGQMRKEKTAMSKDQPTLFELEVLTKYVKDGIECNKCGITQPVENFPTFHAEIKRTCRSCKRNQRKTIYDLRKKVAYPDESYSCPICNRSLKEIARKGQKHLQSWVLDHCHHTETFRGWICGNCNTGLGAFKDSIDRVRNAVAYLQKHEEKIDE
jgi:hypothetical protein